MFEDFAHSGPVYSFGIGTHISFDAQLARMGKQVWMFDHTIEGLPEHHQNFNFYRMGLGYTNQSEANLFTLDYYIDQAGHSARSDMVLKVDVEGAEWDIVPTISDDTLLQFRQIVFEVHWLHQLGDASFREKVAMSLAKLNKNFVLGHVHSNNHTQIGTVEGFVCADVLELTYLRADLAQHKPSKTVYPMELDYPNLITAPDHLLWFYPFYPELADVTVQMLRDSVRWSGDPTGAERTTRLQEEISAHKTRIQALQHMLNDLPAA